MTLGGWPAAKRIEAVPCLRSWNRTGGRPARAMSALNRWLIQPGRSGVPSSRVNTRPGAGRCPPGPGTLSPGEGGMGPPTFET